MKLTRTVTSILLITGSLVASSTSASADVVNYGRGTETLRNLFKSDQPSEVLGDSSDPGKFDQELPTVPEASAVEIELLGGGYSTNSDTTARRRNLMAATSVEGENELLTDMVRNTPNIKIAQAVQSEQDSFSAASEIPEPGTTAALFLVVTGLGFARRQSAKS